MIMEKTNSCSTEWIKLNSGKRSSKIKLQNGKLIYKTHYNKPLKAKIHVRSKHDKHKNNYLSVGCDYVHRLKAKAVYAALGKQLKGGCKIHHRLVDETATEKGNSLPYLVVLSDKDHTRLHYLLKIMAAFIQGNITSYQLNLNV